MSGEIRKELSTGAYAQPIKAVQEDYTFVPGYERIRHPWNLTGLRQRLIILLAGRSSVVVNVDFDGQVYFKGPWLVNYNVLARSPPNDGPLESRPCRSPTCETPHIVSK